MIRKLIAFIPIVYHSAMTMFHIVLMKESNDKHDKASDNHIFKEYEWEKWCRK